MEEEERAQAERKGLDALRTCRWSMSGATIKPKINWRRDEKQTKNF